MTAADCESLDLSTWQVALCGAEPIRPQTLEQFARKFEPCGFRRSAFVAAYGLAEATLGVCVSTPARPLAAQRFDRDALGKSCVIAVPPSDERGTALASVGPVLPELEVAIVRPTTDERCFAGEVGEVWVRGRSVAQGYWNKPEETARVFGARLVDEDDRPYLRTGDLGFLHDGAALRRLAPQGPDHHLRAQPRAAGPRAHRRAVPHRPAARLRRGVLRPSCRTRSGSWSSTSSTRAASRASTPTPSSRRSAARSANNHQLQTYTIALVKRGTIPKTTSGKIQRSLTRKLWLEGKLDYLTAETAA